MKSSLRSSFGGGRKAVVLVSGCQQSSPACFDSYAERDAVRIAAALGSYGYAIRLLKGSTATRRILLEAVRGVREAPVLESLVVVIIAQGRCDGEGVPCLLLEDAVQRDPTTWLSIPRLTSQFKKLTGDRVCFVLPIPFKSAALMAARTAARLATPKPPIGVPYGEMLVVSSLKEMIVEHPFKPERVPHMLLLALLQADGVGSSPTPSGHETSLTLSLVLARFGVEWDAPEVTLGARIVKERFTGRGEARRVVWFGAGERERLQDTPSGSPQSGGTPQHGGATAISVLLHYVVVLPETRGLTSAQLRVVTTLLQRTHSPHLYYLRRMCTELSTPCPEPLLISAMIPGAPSHEIHWGVVVASEVVSEVVLTLLQKYGGKEGASLEVVRVWCRTESHVCVWFASRRTVFDDIFGLASEAPEVTRHIVSSFLVRAAKVGVPDALSLYAIERTVRDSFPPPIPHARGDVPVDPIPLLAARADTPSLAPLKATPYDPPSDSRSLNRSLSSSPMGETHALSASSSQQPAIDILRTPPVDTEEAVRVWRGVDVVSEQGSAIGEDERALLDSVSEVLSQGLHSRSLGEQGQRMVMEANTIVSDGSDLATTSESDTLTTEDSAGSAGTHGEESVSSRGANAVHSLLQRQLAGGSSHHLHAAPSTDNVMTNVLRKASDLGASGGSHSLNLLRRDSGLPEEEDAPFTPKVAMPQYGDKSPGMVFLKYGDKVALLSSGVEGMLALKWHGDGCDASLQTYFGQSRIPKSYENCVFTVERVTESVGNDDAGRPANATAHVAFGNPVRLCHSASGRYVCTFPVVSSPTEGAEDEPEPAYTEYDVASGGFVQYKATLIREAELAASQLDESCLTFRFATSSKLRTDGERVRIGDTCHIISHVGNSLLSAAKEGKKDDKKEKANAIFFTPMKSQTDAYEIPAQSAALSSTRWSVAPYFVRSTDDPSSQGQHNRQDSKTRPDNTTSTAPTPERQRYLETGRPILLFHRELEGFLTARGELTRTDKPCRDGSFLETMPETSAGSVNWAYWGDGENGQRFHLYYDTSGTSAQGRDTAPTYDCSHSSNALWMLEELDPSRGAYLQWLNQRKAYRIKHIASGGYLMAEHSNDNDVKLQSRRSTFGKTDGEVQSTLSLTLQPDKLENVVLLHPVNAVVGTSEERGLHTSSYCRIQFALTQLWLNFAAEDDDAGRTSHSEEDSFEEMIGSPRQAMGGFDKQMSDSTKEKQKQQASFERPAGLPRNTSLGSGMLRHSSSVGKAFLRRKNLSFRLSKSTSLRDLARSSNSEEQQGGAAGGMKRKNSDYLNSSLKTAKLAPHNPIPTLCTTPQYEGAFAIRYASAVEYESLMTLSALKRGLKESVAYWLSTLQAKASTEEDAKTETLALLEKKAKLSPNHCEHIRAIHGCVSARTHDTNLDSVSQCVKLIVKFCHDDKGIANKRKAGADVVHDAKGEDGEKSGFDPYGNHGSVRFEKQSMLFSQEIHLLVLKILQVPVLYREVIQQRLRQRAEAVVGLDAQTCESAPCSDYSSTLSPRRVPLPSLSPSPRSISPLAGRPESQLSPCEMFEEKYAPLFRLCFFLLKNMVKKSQFLSSYLEPYIPFVESMLEHNYHANLTLCEIYSGNTRLLQTLTKEQLRSYVYPTPHLEILSASCVSEDPATSELIGIPRNQDIILSFLERADVGILFPTRGHKGTIWLQPLKGWKYILASDGKSPLLMTQPANEEYEDIPLTDTLGRSPASPQRSKSSDEHNDEELPFPKIAPQNRKDLGRLSSGDLLEMTARAEQGVKRRVSADLWSSDEDHAAPAYYGLPARRASMMRKVRKRGSFALSSRSGDKSCDSLEDHNDYEEPFASPTNRGNSFPPIPRPLSRHDSRRSWGSEASSTFLSYAKNHNLSLQETLKLMNQGGGEKESMSGSAHFTPRGERSERLSRQATNQSAFSSSKSLKANKSYQQKRENGWVSVADFINMYRDSGEQDIIEHFVATITLLGNLCVGADYSMRKRVARTVPFKQVLLGMNMDFHSAYCDAIRTAYARIAKYLYVCGGKLNVDTFEEMSMEESTAIPRSATVDFPLEEGVPETQPLFTQLNTCMSTLTSDKVGDLDDKNALFSPAPFDRQMSVSVVRDLNREGRMKENLLKKIVLLFLNSNVQLITECLHRNQLIVNVLKLLRGMLESSNVAEHQLFSQREKKGLISCLISILDPGTDVLDMARSADPPYRNPTEKAQAAASYDKVGSPSLKRARGNSAFRMLNSSLSGLNAQSKQSFFIGRKRRNSIQNSGNHNIFTSTDLSQMVIETKVEACRVLMTLMSLDRKSFLQTMSEIGRDKRRESTGSAGIDLSFGTNVLGAQSCTSLRTDSANELPPKPEGEQSPRSSLLGLATPLRASSSMFQTAAADTDHDVPPALLLPRILLDVTLYEDNALLYCTALEALFRIMEQSNDSKEKASPPLSSLSPPTQTPTTVERRDLAHLNDESIHHMARFVSNHLILKPMGRKNDKFVYVKSLLRHLRDTPEGDDLGVALLRTFTAVLDGSYTQQSNEKSRKSAQGLLNQLGLTTLIPPILESHHSLVVKSALQCGIALMDGGNRRVQATLFSHFLSRQEETLFKSLADRLRNCILLIETVESDPYLLDYEEYALKAEKHTPGDEEDDAMNVTLTKMTVVSPSAELSPSSFDKGKSYIRAPATSSLSKARRSFVTDDLELNLDDLNSDDSDDDLIHTGTFGKNSAIRKKIVSPILKSAPRTLLKKEPFGATLGITSSQQSNSKKKTLLPVSPLDPARKVFPNSPVEVVKKKTFFNPVETLETAVPAIESIASESCSSSHGEVQDSRALQWYKGTNLFHTSLVLRYLQLFCTTFPAIQHYLRDQHDNVNSFNLIQQSLNLLEQILQIPLIDTFVAEFILQCFSTLSEYSHGPITENQFCLVESGMCLTVNAVFLDAAHGGVDLSLLNEQKPELIEQIRSAAISSVLALLEGVTDTGIPSIMLGMEGLDIDALRDCIIEVWHTKRESERNGDLEKSGYALELGFNIFILFRILQGYWADGDLVGDGLLNSECGRYLSERTGRIEISRGSRLERVYFRIPEVCIEQGLSKRGKEDVLWKVRRNTDTERVTDFIEKGDLLIYEIDYSNRWFSGKTPHSKAPRSRYRIEENRVFRWCGRLCSLLNARLYKEVDEDDSIFNPDSRFRRHFRTTCRKYGTGVELHSVFLAVLTNAIFLSNEALFFGTQEVSHVVYDTAVTAILLLLSVANLILLFMACSSFVVAEAPTLAYKRFRQGEREKLLQLQNVTHLEEATVHSQRLVANADTDLSDRDFVEDASSALSSGQFSPRSSASSHLHSMVVTPQRGSARSRKAVVPFSSHAEETTSVGEDGVSPINALPTLPSQGNLLEDSFGSHAEPAEEEGTTDSEEGVVEGAVLLDAGGLSGRVEKKDSMKPPGCVERVLAVPRRVVAGVVSMWCAFKRAVMGVVANVVAFVWFVLYLPSNTLAVIRQLFVTAKTQFYVAIRFIKGAEDPAVNHLQSIAQACLSTFTFYYYVVMLCFALLGIVYHPLFLALHLMSIARASDILHNVIKAVTQNGRALLLTCVLGVVVVYLFSVVAYVLFQDMIVTNNGEKVCDSLLRCFLYSLTHGVRSDGGLGDHMLDPSYSSRSYSYQMVFEVLFFVLVIVILLNIIFGIIIDTFAELRARRQSIQEDIRNKCFICGLSASEFDRYDFYQCV